jgi:hypothetical protein
LPRVFVDSTNLSKAFDDALSDLENGTGTKLYDLAGILQSIAEVADDPLFYILPQAIGSFADEVLQSRQLVAIPVLPKETRDRQSGLISQCISKAVEQIKAIEDELVGDSMNSERILKALGIVWKQSMILHSERRAIMPRKGPRLTVEEE